MENIALVHDWLVGHRGGEQVLLELARLFPRAPIYTLVYDPSRVHHELTSRDVRTSFIQQLPGAPERFRGYLPLFPNAIESFDLDGYDLVVSTSHCVAKGLKSRAPHLAYVHTPMRYIWDQRASYRPRGVAPRVLFDLTSKALRRWDIKSAARPTALLANSSFVAARIRECWNRDAEVVYPPVDVGRFSPPDDSSKRSGLVVVNALVRYKRTELAVEFANRSGNELTVLGDGPERARLQSIAGPTVRFVARVSDGEVADLYRGAKAFLHCGVEDFGIAPVEAMAAGCPVVAFGQGGVTETVVEGKSGYFFHQPTWQALSAAVDKIEQRPLSSVAICRHAQHFSAERFRQEITNKIKQLGSDRMQGRNAVRRP